MSENLLRCCSYSRFRLRIHWLTSSHFFRSILLAHSLSREPSGDRYIRQLASNPLPSACRQIIREASRLAESWRDICQPASLPIDVNVQLPEADAKIVVEPNEKTPLSGSNCICVILRILGSRWTFMELCCTNVGHKS
jgi:hypothetical protein